MKRHFVMASVALAASSFSAAARAQTTTAIGGMALDQFEPAPAGDAFFGIPAPSAVGHLVPSAILMFDYAHRPLRLVTGGSDTAIVSAQGFLRADASLALWDRLLISVDVPIAILQAGNEPQMAGFTFNAPSSAAMGDLRLGVRGRIFGEDRSPFQIGVGGYLFAPTAPSGSYAGEGAVRGQFHLSLGGRIPTGVPIVWTASGGPLLRGSNNPHAFTFGVGAAVSLIGERLQIGPELYGSTTLGSGVPLSVNGAMVNAASATSVELILGARMRLPAGFFLGAAAGPGLTSAIGTPLVRAIGLVGWSPAHAAGTGPVGDRDGDGFRDDVDACPDVPGGLNGDPTKDGCPPPDRDNDGVVDMDDACPSLPGDRDEDPTKNGCPRDSDGDGIPDKRDACPDRKGLASDDPKRNGCPNDRDGDGVPDEVDACPDTRGVASSLPKWNGCPDDSDGDGIKEPVDACPHEKGVASPDPTKNGCPKDVRVTDNEVVILQQVEFKSYGRFKSETIDPISDELLTEVRDVINQHPEILKIEVQGHTDDSGAEAYNQKLSEQRAQEVRKWLIAAGIPADKVVAKGYGSQKPIADNRIKSGRQKNRRVQFVIVERKSR
ncbi:outer membrane protein OmpA [Minicystis rosea]|nr:outer membrane protein OmpA [Minicystis rosea]